MHEDMKSWTEKIAPCDENGRAVSRETQANPIGPRQRRGAFWDEEIPKASLEVLGYIGGDEKVLSHEDSFLDDLAA